MTQSIDHAVVDVLVEKDGKFLFVQEGKPGREGLYNLPGGHVEPHETLFDAAIREAKEESGYDIELSGLIGIYQTVLPHINISGPVFAGRVVGGEALATDEHPEVVWLTLDEIHQLRARGKLFTSYPPHAAEQFIAGKILPLEAVICNVAYM